MKKKELVIDESEWLEELKNLPHTKRGQPLFIPTAEQKAQVRRAVIEDIPQKVFIAWFKKRHGFGSYPLIHRWWVEEQQCLNSKSKR